MIELNLIEYKRIIVIGNNGSGKSFLSRELQAITGLPLFHLDLEFWRPNWEQPPKEEWIKRQVELISKEKWIIDGNHSGVTMELRFQKADLLIFLDINRLICLLGVIERHGKKRSDMPHYLKERLDIEHFKFLLGLWRFPKRRKVEIMKLHDKYEQLPFLVIRSRNEMKKFLIEWKEYKKMELVE